LQAEKLRTGIVGCTKDIEAVAAAAKAGRISHVGEVGDGGEIGCEPSPGNRAEKAVRAGVNGERLRLRRWCLEQSDEAEDECSGFFHGVFDEYVNRGFAHGKWKNPQARFFGRTSAKPRGWVAGGGSCFNTEETPGHEGGELPEGGSFQGPLRREVCEREFGR